MHRLDTVYGSCSSHDKEEKHCFFLCIEFSLTSCFRKNFGEGSTYIAGIYCLCVCLKYSTHAVSSCWIMPACIKWHCMSCNHENDIYVYWLIGVSLGKPHTSVTALCVCLFVGLFGLTTYGKFQMSAFTPFMVLECTYFSSNLWNEDVGLLPDCTVSVKESKSKNDLQFECIASTQGNLLCDKSMLWVRRSCVTRLWVTECMVVRAALSTGMIAHTQFSLLAHDLSVKLLAHTHSEWYT